MEGVVPAPYAPPPGSSRPGMHAPSSHASIRRFRQVTRLGEIEQSFAEAPVATAGEGAGRIESISGIRLSDSQARRIMVRLGMRFRKCAGVPGKADPQLQFSFLEDELLPRLEEARRGGRRVFFVDAAHFVLGAFLGMIWSFTRIFVPSGCGRQRYNVLGAVETRDHDLVSVRTTGSVNAGTVCELVRKIDETYPGEEITLVMDNARYQRNKACSRRPNGWDRAAVPAALLAQPQPD